MRKIIFLITITSLLLSGCTPEFNRQLGIIPVSMSDVTGLTSSLNAKEGTITGSGDEGDYWTGMKTWKPLPTGSNVTLPIAITDVTGLSGNLTALTDNASGQQTQINNKAPLDKFAATTATFSTTSTSLVDIQNLYVYLEANKRYLIECGLSVGTSASSAGIRYGVSYNGSYSSMEFQIQGKQANWFYMAGARISANNTATVGDFMTTSGDTNGSVRITGVINTTTSGNFSVKTQKQTSGTSYVYAGSWLKAEEK